MPGALGHQRPGHGQDQPEVLDEHRRIVDALAEQRPQADLDQRHEQHQGERRAGKQRVERVELPPERRVARGEHYFLPARKAFRWPITSSKVSAGTSLPRMRG